MKSVEEIVKIEWNKVRRVFAGALVECEPCHSEGFMKYLHLILQKSLSEGFTFVVGCCSVIDDEALDKAEKQMKEAGVLGWPYIRVYFKGNKKPQTYFGMTVEENQTK